MLWKFSSLSLEKIFSSASKRTNKGILCKTLRLTLGSMFWERLVMSREDWCLQRFLSQREVALYSSLLSNTCFLNEYKLQHILVCTRYTFRSSSSRKGECCLWEATAVSQLIVASK